MTRQAVVTVVAVLLALTAPLPLPAQTAGAPPVEVEKEASRREETFRLLESKLQQADRDVADGKLADATKRYEDALSYANRVGPKADPQKARAIAGISSTRLSLARTAHRSGHLPEAVAHVDRILRVDPLHAEAARLKQDLDQAIAKTRGLTPSADSLGQLPEIKEKKTKVSTLVQDARVFLQAGEPDKAEVKLREALELDASSEPANYYMKLILDEKGRIEAKRRGILSKEALLHIDEVWNKPLTKNNLPIANPFATTNLVHTSKGRQGIKSKLERIRLDEVNVPNLPLRDAVTYLRDEAKKRDPDGVGINFYINQNLDNAATGGGFQVDPNTGQQIPVAPAEQKNLRDEVYVNIDPPLNGVRLLDALDAITKSADFPIKYTIEDYAVVFQAKAPERAQLVTRFFRVNPNTFQSGLESVAGISFGDFQTGSAGGAGGGGGGGGGQGGQGGTLGTVIPRVFVSQAIQGGQGGGGGGGGGFGGGGGGTGSNGLRGVTIPTPTADSQQLVRDFFLAAGVNLTFPNVVFFNDRLGLLMVRATTEEIEIVEQAVEVLNAAPPMVEIEAKFAEVGQDDLKGLGFDWTVGNFSAGDFRMNPGTAPSFGDNPFAPTTVFPGSLDTSGLPTGPGVVSPSSTDGVLTGGVRNRVSATAGTAETSLPTLGTITGVLTDPQFRVAIRALEQRGGIELMAAPRVTTLSGRQAQVQINDLRTIVTGVNLGQTAGGGGQNAGLGAGANNAAGAIGSQLNYITQITPFGPVLDVVPYVAADGYTIEMSLIPTFSEFLGYDDPGAFVPQIQGAAGNSIGLPLTAQLPLPRLRVRQVVTSAVVWDGQTVVLGGLISEDIRKHRDKVPFFGDIPWLGRLFRSESTAATKRNLVIFITPKIIDPAGNRVHSPDNLPYDPRETPTQAKAAQ